MAKSEEPITIKKYANRRLYNTGTSTYVTLEDLADMVKAGEDFVVYDAKTGEDITRSVLAQIIFEQENKEGQNLLPINFLRQLIRFYGDSMQMLVPRYLEVSIDSLTREQEKFREQMAQAFGVGGFGAIEEQVRRNMEMFERAFAMFAPFARQGGKPAAERGQAGQRRTSQRRRRDRRAQAPDGRDAEAARPAERQGQVAAASSRRASATASDKSVRLRSRLRATCAIARRRRPRPLDRGQPDQRALQVVAAPVRQHRGGCLVLHPFGDGLQAEPLREIDQRAHEGAVVLGAHQVLHEGAVDLEDVDAELAQVAERGVAGAEIVDRDAAAEILHAA